MNILLTSAGRRTYMVDYFKKAVGADGRVYAANSQMSPALHEADGMLISPIIFSREYVPFLLDKCKELSIDLIVSFFDIDMPVLSAHRQEFEAIGTRLAMSDSSFYEICSDKFAMGQELGRAGLHAARAYVDIDRLKAALNDGFADDTKLIAKTAHHAIIGSAKDCRDAGENVSAVDSNSIDRSKEALRFPLIVKPRFGMGSIGVYKVYNELELDGAYSMCERAVKNSYLKYESENVPEDNAVLIQECLEGNEYGLDVICDFDGAYVNTIVRRKIAMRSGETDEAVVLGEGDAEYAALTELGEQFAKHFRPRGITDMDVIMGDEAVPRIIDINGRFGGGYPFSHIAGADVPKAYVLWLHGRKAEAAACCRAMAGVHGYKDIEPRVYQ